MKKWLLSVFIMVAILTAMARCGSRQENDTPAIPTEEETVAAQTTDPESTEEQATEQPVTEEAFIEETIVEEEIEEPPVIEEVVIEEVTEKMLRMMIGDTVVAVEWENNESVEALKALCEEEPLVIQMSMYGGFEQVGPIGTRLPSDDVQTSTSAGDIVLYSSNQIVVFYGSNSWAYTRLGHITDQDASGMASLLGNGNVTITLRMEDAE